MVAFIRFLSAAGSVFGLAQASPLITRDTAYRTYKGDGTVAHGWPGVKDWADFETM